MKRIVFFITAISLLFLFSGCTGMQIVREVDENNVFISSGKPNVRIKIEKSLKYLEQSDHSKSASSWSGGESSTNKKVKKYIFESDDSKSKKMEIILSSLSSSNWRFSSKLYDTSGTLASGKMKVDGKEYQYITYHYSSGEVNYLAKSISRRVGAKNNSKITIRYREIVSDDWSNQISQLTSAQRDELNKFNTAFDNSFQIL